jgi:hypothetical protein
MRLEHITKMEAGYTMGLQPDGRELLVVCVKGTFTIPKRGEEPRLAEEQVPLLEADVYSGEPGLSAPVYESDYAPRKPKCDVLLNGRAYAPGGRPTTRVNVDLQVGSISKSFAVVGYRAWKKGYLSISPSPPKPFVAMPISYDTAFGGVDKNNEDPKKHRAYMENPIGVGFHSFLNSEFVNEKPLPNTEELRKPIKKPDGKYRPMSFGPIGRGWQPRYPLAGTYDQNWVDNVFPFLPADFNEAYYQAASPDQQMPYPRGGEIVTLVNLTPEGRTVFRLPYKNIVVWFFLKDGSEKDVPAVADTIVIEPDKGYITITWRAALPLRKNVFEVELALIVESEGDLEKLLPKEEISFPLIGEDSEAVEASEIVEEE